MSKGKTKANFKIVKEFVHALRAFLQIPDIKITRDHIMTIKYKDEFEVVIKFEPNHDLVYFFAPIRTVDSLTQQQGMNFMLNCMSANHLFIRTRGATLSFSPEENIVALNFSYSTATATANEIMRLLAVFCDTSEQMRLWAGSDKALQPGGDEELMIQPTGL